MFCKLLSCIQLSVFISMLSITAPAGETVVTEEGTQITGDVSFDGEVYVVKSANGMETKLPKDFVKQVLLPQEGAQLFAKKIEALEQSPRKEDAEEWYKLGAFAQVCGLDDIAAKCFDKAISLDPNNVAARTALGYNLVKGKWVKEEETLALGPLPGQAAGGGAPPWADAYKPQNPQVKSTDKNTAPATAKKSPATKQKRVLIMCPDCEGTGVSVWITCAQCSRSGQPGFVYLGEKYELCPRCAGAGRWSGMKCKRCLGTGKIDPDKQKLQTQEKQPPPGFHFCPKCDGTAFEEWKPCDKCAWQACEYCAKLRNQNCVHCGGLGKVKSPVPGYVYVRGNQVMCDKCHGMGKLPLKRCTMCGSTGVIRDEEITQ